MNGARAPKTLQQRDMRPPENIRKVAVTMPGEKTQFIELNQNLPLAAIIENVVQEWKLPDIDGYALQFTDANRQNYITERNRHEIENGNVLKLSDSPAKTAEKLLHKLKEGMQLEKNEALQELCSLSSDSTFAQEFIGKNGHLLLITMVESGLYLDSHFANLLKSFVQIMDHQILSWEILEQLFITKVGICINAKGTDVISLQAALEIMESIILQSTTKCFLAEKEITTERLVQFLQSGNPQIQKASLALMNAMFTKASPERRKRMSDNTNKTIRKEIQSHCLKDNMSSDMKHQLYVFQSLILNLLDERMKSLPDDQDPESVRKITELRSIAFHIDTESAPHHQSVKRQSYAKDYKKLGFQNTLKPIDDFNEVPPGLLALDSMYYFAKTYCENYKKVVLENSCKDDEHDCPVAMASIHLTKMMCEIFNVGETPSEEDQQYHPMFFTHDKPFEEFYCICIQLLSKTWREMRATAQDFTKVLNVVREQISRTLDNHPQSFEVFRKNLDKLTYSEITNLWHKERQSKDEFESKVKPIMELREKIKPEIMDLIKQQRLNSLMGGGMFPKARAVGRHKGSWFCRLSPNMKVLHYGDVTDESSQPSLEQLPHKCAVADMKSLATGKDCPHYKDRERGRKGPVLAFSILSDTTEQPLNFQANSEHQYNIWTDGVNALLGNPMTSDQTNKDLDTLLSMEIKLRLLDTEGVDIPLEPPEIPPEPPNYDFYYKY